MAILACAAGFPLSLGIGMGLGRRNVRFQGIRTPRTSGSPDRFSQEPQLWTPLLAAPHPVCKRRDELIPGFLEGSPSVDRSAWTDL